MRFRVPIRLVTVFGVTALVALAAGLVFYLGFVSATKNTTLLMTNQARGLMGSMEQEIALWLRPVQQQARWIAAHIASDPPRVDQLESFDDFMLGALAATNQVAGIAVVKPDGTSRRWTRETGSAITEDWSSRQEIQGWINDGKLRTEAAWLDPFFTDTIDKTVLLHDFPIHDRHGNLLAMLGQIVPIEELSTHVADRSLRDGMTPFILYGRDRVLAHPLLSKQSANAQESTFKPMIALNELDDPVLQRIWTPDEQELFFLRDENQFQTSGAFIVDQKRFYIYIYQVVEGYGPTPWVIGAHLNTEIYGGEESQRLMRALLGSIGVLLAALIGAVYLGRYITRPITAIAAATHLVDVNKLDEVPLLPHSRMKELDDAAQSFNNMIVDLRERTLIRQTLGQFVPEKVASTLLSEGGTLRSKTANATVLCSDIEGFTQLTETLGASKVVDVLNAYFSTMVEIVERHHGVVTQFHGDSIIATFNTPIDNPEHAKCAILAATEMLSAVESQQFAGHVLRARIGIDTGPVLAGAVGAAGRLSYTVYGNSVNLAARLEQHNKTIGTRLLISENTVKLAGDTEGLQAVGKTSIRGQAKLMQAYTLMADSALPHQADV